MTKSRFYVLMTSICLLLAGVSAELGLWWVALATVYLSGTLGMRAAEISCE